MNLEEVVVYIRAQRTALTNGKVHHGEPKGTSARILPIGPGITELLTARKVVYEEEAWKAYQRWKGPENRSEGYVRAGVLLH